MDIHDRISAWLDGALPAEEVARLEAEAAADPEVAALMADYKAQDAELALAFDSLLEDPVPEALAAAATGSPPAAAPAPVPANSPHPPRWAPLSAAAMLALVALGAGGGALLTRAYFPATEVVEVQQGWMADIADYHRVYAAQGRHLAEVPASEKDHIETWLSAQTGVDFAVPDLTASGFVFEGARLLVAGGKPVVQLLFRGEDGAVLALCALQSEGAGEGFEARSFGADVAMVRWFDDGAAWVAVGTPQMPLEDLARTASGQV